MPIKMHVSSYTKKRRSEWVTVKNSGAYRQWAGLLSYWRHVADGEGVTVFETPDGDWKWVYDGEFSDEFGSCSEAQEDAESELSLS